MFGSELSYGHRLVVEHTIYSSVVGSRAYGLHGPDSDTDRRGVFLVPTPAFWNLDKPPTHVDGPGTEQFSWELERCCTLALQANPTVLECLWSPIVEQVTATGRELLALRPAFLSQRVADSYGDYARDQMRRLDNARQRTGEVRWKQAMHMVRLLLAGGHVLRTGEVLVDVSAHRDRLLAIRRGEVGFDEVRAMASRFADELATARAATAIPVEPDRAAVSDFLTRVRRASALETDHAPPDPTPPDLVLPDWVGAIPAEIAYPTAFVTVSGAHSYGFASVDSDVDLRGVHILPLSEVVGLRHGPQTLQRGGLRDGVELDLVTHDLAMFLGLLLKPNGYVAEQLLSPLVVQTTDLHAELVALAPGCLTRHHSHHYRGFANGQWKLFESTGRLKPALYTLRVVLTGIHLMRTGEIVADLRQLYEGHHLPYVPDLI